MAMTALHEEPGWHVGDDIRKARKNAGMEQAELATLVGVARATLSKWERGLSEPTISQFRAIARETNAPWLLSQNAKFLTFLPVSAPSPVPMPRGAMELALGIARPALDIIECRG